MIPPGESRRGLARLATRTFLALAIVGAAACVAAPARMGAGGGDPTAGADGCPVTPGQAVVLEMNRHRVDAGLPPYRVDVRLVRAARVHSADMASGDFLSHTGSDGSRPAERVRREGYPWRVVAENIAAGQADARDAVRAWMGSPGHRENILWTEAHAVGVGRAVRSGSGYATYWTAAFGRASDSIAAPAGGCHP